MKLTVRLKGGSGSGNFGHEGRPGLVGGSAGDAKHDSYGNIVSTDASGKRTVASPGSTDYIQQGKHGKVLSTTLSDHPNVRKAMDYMAIEHRGRTGQKVNIPTKWVKKLPEIDRAMKSISKLKLSDLPASLWKTKASYDEDIESYADENVLDMFASGASEDADYAIGRYLRSHGHAVNVSNFLNDVFNED